VYRFEGIVLGDITSDSKVSLYETSSLNFTIVMSEIRTAQPVSWEIVNESGGFRFNYLSHGTYAFVIPTSSYKRSVGSPLPYEFDCRNFSLRIAFQGGDPRYAVGAFSIRDSTAQNRSTCARNSLSCNTLRGSLYKKCQEGKKPTDRARNDDQGKEGPQVCSRESLEGRCRLVSI